MNIRLYEVSMGSGGMKNKIIIVCMVGFLVVAGLIVFVIIKTKNDNNSDEEKTFASETVTKVVELNEKNTNEITETLSKSDENSDAFGTNVSDKEESNIAESSDEIDKDVSEVSVNLGEYKGIKLEYTPKEVTEEMIEEELIRIKDENSYYVKLPDREFKEGDMAIVSYNGFVDGSYIDDLSVYCLQVIIGSNILPDYIEQAIIGHEKGDFFDVYREFPEDYETIPEIAGKNVQFNIELVDGFELYVPALTDSFIRETTGYDSIQDFKSKMKETLQEKENQKAYNEMLYNLKIKLVGESTFTGNIDDKIKIAYIKKLQENDKMAQEYYMDGATYYSLMEGLSLEEYQKKMMDEATLEVEYEYVLDEIAMKEGMVDRNPEMSAGELRDLAEKFVIDESIHE